MRFIYSILQHLEEERKEDSFWSYKATPRFLSSERLKLGKEHPLLATQ